MGPAHPQKVHQERAEQQAGRCAELPVQRETRRHFRALLGSGVEAGAAGSFQGLCSWLPVCLQLCSRRCSSSSGRWRQLGRGDWLSLSRLLALAGAAGKMSTQGMSTPSSITICQTFIHKVPKQRKCWCHRKASLGPDLRVCSTGAPLLGSEARKEELRWAHFTCHPLLGNENLSGWQIKKPSGEEQQVFQTGATLKNQRNRWWEQR